LRVKQSGEIGEEVCERDRGEQGFGQTRYLSAGFRKAA
jgi:hypothetical protein